MVQKSRLRVEAVSFLNTKPLIYPLLNGEIRADIELSVNVPSRAAMRLSAGEIDVGLISSIEYFRSDPLRGAYCILPGISIASHGCILSIQLFSRVPIREIRRVALDTNSRTSVALLKILLAEMYQISPCFTACAPTVDPQRVLCAGVDAGVDAILLIGDSALRHLGSTAYSLDLGEAWYRFAGLPFVYACWVARREVDLGDLPELLLASKARGISDIPEIARVESKKLGLPEALCVAYLQRHIKFDLGESEIAGLELFYKYAVKNRLAPSCRSLLFKQI